VDISDLFLPPVRTYYYSLGTQIYCAPTIDSRDTWQSSMQHIALEGRCFVLSACQFATEKDYPPDHAVADPNNRNPDNIMLGGGSVIISPLGKVLAGPTRQPEEILTADLDLDDVVRGKFDLDSVGHYARPDGIVPHVSWLSCDSWVLSVSTQSRHPHGLIQEQAL
jgi:predicted amidohydrolase